MLTPGFVQVARSSLSGYALREYQGWWWAQWEGDVEWFRVARTALPVDEVRGLLAREAKRLSGMGCGMVAAVHLTGRVG